VCGMPGSGKTTLARRLAASHGALLVNPDEWLVRLGLDVHDGPTRHAIESLMWEQTQQLLGIGTSIVLESGLWVREHRDEKLAAARRIGVQVELHVLDVPLEERWRRVAARNARGHGVQITRAQLEAWERRWQPPTADEVARYDPPSPLTPASRRC